VITLPQALQQRASPSSGEAASRKAASLFALDVDPPSVFGGIRKKNRVPGPRSFPEASIPAFGVSSWHCGFKGILPFASRNLQLTIELRFFIGILGGEAYHTWGNRETKINTEPESMHPKNVTDL